MNLILSRWSCRDRREFDGGSQEEFVEIDISEMVSKQELDEDEEDVEDGKYLDRWSRKVNSLVRLVTCKLAVLPTCCFPMHQTPYLTSR